MQCDDLDILSTLTSLLKSVKEVEKLSFTPLDKWPTYASTLLKCTENEGNVLYESQKLKNFKVPNAILPANIKLTAQTLTAA